MIEEVRRSYSRRRDDYPDHGVVQGHDGIKDDVEVLLWRGGGQLCGEKAEAEVLGAGGEGEHQGAALQ